MNLYTLGVVVVVHVLMIGLKALPSKYTSDWTVTHSLFWLGVVMLVWAGIVSITAKTVAPPSGTAWMILIIAGVDFVLAFLCWYVPAVLDSRTRLRRHK